MRSEQLYLTKVIPFLIEFTLCEIYNFELKNLDQELAESINQKNIYTALDLPDFRNIKEVKLQSSVIKLTCKKLKLGKVISIIEKSKYKILEIDEIKYQLIFFPSGSVPEFEVKCERIIFFMYQAKFQKIYYCGKFDLVKLSKVNIDKFCSTLFFNDTKKFIGFNELIK